MNNLHFDPYQFAGRGAFPASAATHIAFSDYKNTMHTVRRSANPAAWIPPFALNDKQLQQVLLLRARRYIHCHGKPAAEDLEKINRAATSKALRGNRCIVNLRAPAIQREMVEKHAAAVRRAGGYLQLHASIAFRAWRLGMNSVEVAETLGMTPQAVRQALWRMRDTARGLGFDTGHVGYTAGRKRKQRKKMPSLKSAQASRKRARWFPACRFLRAIFLCFLVFIFRFLPVRRFRAYRGRSLEENGSKEQRQSA